MCIQEVGFSQNNLRIKQILIQKDTTQLDSLLILPATVKLFHQNQEIDKSWYRIDPGKGELIADPKLIEVGDSLLITYRIYDYNISKPLYTRDISDMNLAGDARPRIRSTEYRSNNRGILNSSQLQKQGNYSRGISYGNNQDVVTNSNLNLQLSGKLSEDVNILAAISDNNIPIQPDGNTQSIQDFDRIYIKLFDDKRELTLGDYEIESPEGNFMRFYKKVQGGKFSGLISKGKNGNELKSTISASIAKGKFRRMEIQGSEGIQGPYRLTGVNNESFIVVLAGSEKVFVDGKKMTRGENYDYVINYNTAELSFTTQRPITRNSRIVVEFEYSEENYSRYLIFNANEYQTKKGKIWFNFYHEQDSKNQPLDQTLSNENKQLLSEIGDKLDLAVVPNEEIVEYSNDFVLYRKVSREVNQVTYDIYEYSTIPEEAIYRVNFSFVGSNGGNYIQVNSVANGRVYQWVDPLDGVPQGEYAPVAKLIPPQKQQMLSLGADYQLAKNLRSRFEIAMSNRDLNSFSSLDDSDNQGLAADLLIRKKSEITDSSKVLISELKMHFIQKNFAEIENFRSVEFNRDWNISDDENKKNESYLSLANQFRNLKWGTASHNISILNRGSGYEGINQNVNLDYQRKKWSVRLNGNLLNTDQREVESKFYRHQLDAAYTGKILKIGIETENENNKIEKSDDKTLLANSFSYHSYKFYMENSDSTQNQFQAYYRKRKDFMPMDNELKSQSESEDIGGKIWLKKNRNNQLKIESIYRRLSISENSLTNEEPENTFLGKLEHKARIKKGLLQTSTYYELGSGLESEKEFSYVEVNDGQGVYRWTDYNGNGAKELNEFEIATFKDEANYIRIATNTNNYDKVYTSDFRQTFTLRLRRIKSKSKFVTFLSRFSNRFAYRLSKKSLSNDFNLYANPFETHSSDENLITINSSFQNTFSYRKAKSKTNWDIIHLSSRNKQLLTQGFERRRLTQNGFRFNWNMGKSSQLSNRTDYSKKSLYHEVFAKQDYNLKEIKNELQLKFQTSLVFQFGLNYTYQRKRNKLASEESTTHNVGANCQYAITKTGKLLANLNFLHLDYNADTNSSIAYEMLEGFLPGNNSTWSLAYNQQVSKVFQMNISYNGRQSEGGKTIHVGSMEVRAYF
ncbi:hypothetical protein [Marinifilum caeruleilacunae]|uniref:DUF2460 domain-containing protein n=1 Tax=Marinifilum caeruleilacunae TaxID=2499076 RepID=A0ABX1WXL3_9BACT|nr:hypothetical protein [Marinifilum caeruleilacunae]NOU60832.1 hypothetical protein [Marinifilum caeruleilacunae]